MRIRQSIECRCGKRTTDEVLYHPEIRAPASWYAIYVTRGVGAGKAEFVCSRACLLAVLDNWISAKEVVHFEVYPPRVE